MENSMELGSWKMYVKIAEFVKGKHIYVNKIVVLSKIYVRFEIFTAVTIKNAVLWVVAACRSYVNRRSPETSVQTPSTRRHIPEHSIHEQSLGFI
jgi:hypothetical protein